MTDKEIAVDFIQKKINKLTWNLEDDSHHLELFGDYTHYKTDAGHFRALSLCNGLELILKEVNRLEKIEAIIKDYEENKQKPYKPADDYIRQISEVLNNE